MKRTLLMLLVLAAGLTDCSSGGPSHATLGPSHAESSACAPFLHSTVPTTSLGESESVIIIVPSDAVARLLDSGDPHLVRPAKTIAKAIKARSPESQEAVRAVISECRRLTS